MIVYRLACAEGHEFEGWFRDSAGFDAEAAGGRVHCPECGSHRVEKALMAPRLGRGLKADREPTVAPVPAQEQRTNARDPRLAALLKAVREHVEKNFDYVGSRFPEEARRMHYGETEHRDIYGEASLEEANDMLEEGLSVAPLPRLPRQDA